MTPPHPLQAGNFHGLDTFSTEWKGSSGHSSRQFLYTPSMADVDSKTKIKPCNYSKDVTNIMVSPKEEGFDLLFLDALKITGDHVDEAEIVLTWHFVSLEHMNELVDQLTASVLRQKSDES